MQKLLQLRIKNTPVLHAVKINGKAWKPPQQADEEKEVSHENP